MKITSAMVDDVERMLAEGLISQRKIAKLVGISRGTVNSIALGRRPRISAPPDAFEPQRGPLVRCPGCGGKVYLPCLLCHVRQLKARDHELQGCSHRGGLRRGAHLHGSDARTCRQPGAHRFSDLLHRMEPQAAVAAQSLTASPSVLAPAPVASSFTPAARRSPDVGVVPTISNSSLAEPADNREPNRCAALGANVGFSSFRIPEGAND